ncbi:MAG: hypothetical protein K5784_11530 [Clostridiales bacterium]|nr:hypothetical protein [Clostridiales bacterium]
MAKQNIYDDEVFFEHFKSLRAGEINFNDVIETPIITSMLPDLKGEKVLDIGCGMGQHAGQYARMGGGIGAGDGHFGNNACLRRQTQRSGQYQLPQACV